MCACGHEEYIDVPPIDTLDVKSELWKARARLAVEAAYTEESKGSVRIRTKPSKGVVTTEPAKVRAIKLVPMTTSIMVTKENDQTKGPTRIEHAFDFNKEPYGLTLVCPKLNVEERQVAVEGTCRPGAAPALFGPAYWFVQPTRDAAEANMDTSNVKIPIDVHGAGMKLSIPIMQNSKALKEGEELFYYKPLPKASAASASRTPAAPKEASCKRAPKAAAKRGAETAKPTPAAKRRK